jgi:hypothetical protein
VGNKETNHTGFVNIDTSAPVTTATGLQADNHSGWQNTSQSVTLSADDGSGSGATIYYKLDGGAQQTYASAFTVSGQNSHSGALLVGRRAPATPRPRSTPVT